MPPSNGHSMMVSGSPSPRHLRSAEPVRSGRQDSSFHAAGLSFRLGHSGRCGEAVCAPRKRSRQTETRQSRPLQKRRQTGTDGVAGHLATDGPVGGTNAWPLTPPKKPRS
ncbi:hypothetical protein N657DRAFT_208413 [Parathielavia appendiculata]|uniref:Uncharacterized protein n=1 Tax=Parathielavia appendiculata TaxID=2587402 RepID=A0AAN6U735_9PEZI|nr:hypothetical protein N657DRAFT_208413 [Parathielavia appendiculata]